MLLKCLNRDLGLLVGFNSSLPQLAWDWKAMLLLLLLLLLWWWSLQILESIRSTWANLYDHITCYVLWGLCNLTPSNCSPGLISGKKWLFQSSSYHTSWWFSHAVAWQCLSSTLIGELQMMIKGHQCITLLKRGTYIICFGITEGA